MSRTLPWRCGAAPLQACVDDGSGEWQRVSSGGKTRHLTGMPRSSQPYATVSAVAREEPDILCRLPGPCEWTASVQRWSSLLAIALLRVVSQPRESRQVWPPRSRTRGRRPDSSGRVVLAAVMPDRFAPIRWRYLLDPIGPTRFRPVLRATIIGFAALRCCRRAPATCCGRISWRARRAERRRRRSRRSSWSACSI